MNMDNLLKELVEADRKACAMVDNAEEDLEMTISNMDREIDSFKNDYSERAKKRIGIVRDTENKASEETADHIGKRYDDLMANLEKCYAENHTRWEEELLERCIGR